MTKLILLRHGQSRWNSLNRFTGWVDVDLTPKGIEEALHAGTQIKDIPIDIVYTSTLIRAQMTATLAMSCHQAQKPLIFMHSQGKEKEWGAQSCSKEALDEGIPTYISWHLNERYYGGLQGMNKDEARKKFGADQVHIWRRSFDIPPPNGESLELTAKRTLPYFKDVIVKALENNKNVLIAAHGNSLRSIVMYIEKLTDKSVVKLEIPTGKPLIYHYNNKIFEKLG
ncbi:MAG: 2,3-bisphosphoglycerate-dependent phosphoglycerate mutase [Chlamydiae bacterium]|nr:2,3-bisphosphoglycerate-dependent phosphoglycerate mutase [Chlamydiota bacterium]